MNILDWLQSDSGKAAGRNVVSAVCAIAGMIGVLTVTQSHDLLQAWGDVQTGLAQAAKGMSIIIGIVGVPAMAWWASHKASPAVQKQAVASMPNTLVVTTTAAPTPVGAPPATEAANVAATTRLAASIATHPEVQQVLTTAAIESATVSDKVVSDPHAASG